MEPFNIKIGFGDTEVTLTIIPSTEAYYKVSYFGGIVGAIRPDPDGEGWEPVPDEAFSIGDLKRYEPDLTAERLDFVWCEHTINLIGEEIAAISKD